MPNPNPSVETRIKKGEVRNPLGAGAQHPEIRALRNLTKDEMAEVGSLIVKGDLAEIRQIIEDSKPGSNSKTKHSTLKVMLASVAIRVINRGDMHALDILLNRLIGRPIETIDHQGLEKIMPRVVVMLPPNGFESPQTPTTIQVKPVPPPAEDAQIIETVPQIADFDPYQAIPSAVSDSSPNVAKDGGYRG